MHKVLKFAYTDQVEENMIDTKLLLAADKYEISDLRVICENHLATKLTLENALEIAVDTFQYGSTPYQYALLKFISQHWRNIQNAENFYLIEQRPDLLVKIITHQNDDLPIMRLLFFLLSFIDFSINLWSQ